MSSGLTLVFDGILALTLPILVWRTLVSRDLREAVVLYIAFGLLAAIAWARLDAPDIAVVEAAVGAGLTGVLMMSALGWLPSARVEHPRRRRVASLLPALAIAACLVLIVVEIAEPRPTLRELVVSHLDATDVSNRVTAVLLNFRGYDTLLEVMVLVTVAIGMQALFPRLHAPSHAAPVVGPLLVPLVHGLVPLFVVTSGYLVWKGSHGPGGAFQAGALLAGGAVLLVLARPGWPPAVVGRVRGLALVVGPGYFLLLAAWLLIDGRNLLDYPPRWAKTLIVSVEFSLGLSIAAALTMFFPRPLSSEAIGETGETDDTEEIELEDAESEQERRS